MQCHDTKICIVTEAGLMAEFVSQYTGVYCDRQGSKRQDAVSRHGREAKPRHGAGARDTWPRHGRLRAATRPSPMQHGRLGACDTTPLLPRHGTRARLGAPVRAG